jgi:hypothetical protein
VSKTCNRISPLGGWLLLLGCTIGMQNCWAGTFDIELRITPEVPRPFQPITVHALQDPCFYRFGLNLTAFEVLEGNVIRVVVPYEGRLLCQPMPVVPFQWTIPGVPAGGYRLELMAVSPGVPDYYLLESINIQVAPGAVPEPHVVPSTSWIGLEALVLSLVFGANWRWRRSG